MDVATATLLVPTRAPTVAAMSTTRFDHVEQLAA
jgi:hypothetical protein